MANHIIALSTTEETIYQRYLTVVSKTDEEIMASLKTSLATQVVAIVDEAGKAKFDGLSVANKIAFLDS